MLKLVKVKIRGYDKSVSESPGFVFLADHPAVDLANTVYAPAGELLDVLESWPRLVQWLEDAQLAPAKRLHLSGAAAIEALAEVTALRDAWRVQIARMVEGQAVSDRFIANLNQLLERESFAERLAKDADGHFSLTRVRSTELKGLDLALVVIARGIATFLAECDPQYLRQCAAQDCVLYFYDTTKNHRRQWCSAATCGNRHKVAAFRERQARRRE